MVCCCRCGVVDKEETRSGRPEEAVLFRHCTGLCCSEDGVQAQRATGDWSLSAVPCKTSPLRPTSNDHATWHGWDNGAKSRCER